MSTLKTEAQKKRDEEQRKAMKKLYERNKSKQRLAGSQSSEAGVNKTLGGYRP